MVVSSALESGLGLAFLARLTALAAAEGAMGLGTESVFRGDPLRHLASSWTGMWAASE
ncbi:MAG: hypothetical protein R3E85_07240 [Planctomycetota bacterium]